MSKMKIKKGYEMRAIADQVIVVPLGKEALNFNGMITLNASGKLLFEALQKATSKDNCVALLLEHYDIDQETAERDVEAFIATLAQHNLLDDA